MLNKVMIIGRLGRDPELRYTQSGSPVATLNVATDESYMDRDGNKVERTEWHRVSVFQRQAENCANFLTKGSLVYVEGSLQTRARPRAVPRPSSATTIWVPPSPPKLPTWTKCPSRHGCRIWSIWQGVPHGERPAFFVSGDRQARTAPVPPFFAGIPCRRPFRRTRDRRGRRP